MRGVLLVVKKQFLVIYCYIKVNYIRHGYDFFCFYLIKNNKNQTVSCVQAEFTLLHFKT